MYLISEKIVKARKQHKCTQCDQQILVGEKYECQVGTWNGPIQKSRTHLDCARAALDFHNYSGFYFDDGVCLIQDLCDEDHEWLAWRHPSVALRMNLVLTPFI